MKLSGPVTIVLGVAAALGTKNRIFGRVNSRPPAKTLLGLTRSDFRATEKTPNAYQASRRSMPQIKYRHDARMSYCTSDTHFDPAARDPVL